MSDPLSIVGSGVGIISLGLQVCKETVSYCEAWRVYDEDIQRIATKADELRLALKQLHALIEDPRLNDPDTQKDLEEKAFSLESTVIRLHKAVGQLKPVLSNSVPDKIRAQLKRASYPFRKDTLRIIENDLDGMQIALQTTLAMYSTRKITEIGTVSETILGKVEQIVPLPSSL
ncbi:hypothetical protein P170DRAFT_473519 [Aspergillus steynii IBT 23096]|uniref:Fungal N-terminal domain-containing protein n=1 Tax=Aspergillus steynii IBT 23096 TaxID=1392250 RepID=A0A2I2GAP8_9EURO|nr:uncharacterized protein P170DRAFT_473519 [Aspergillus steynii IBT 23096]PLB49942.1 hypothetical protein P170DRAFT_473519 [Aspergillus steynii IBT 23096]